MTPRAGDLVCCLADEIPGTHIRRIVTRAFELECHEMLYPSALCGASAWRDTLDVVDDATCPGCLAALARVPR